MDYRLGKSMIVLLLTFVDIRIITLMSLHVFLFYFFNHIWLLWNLSFDGPWKVRMNGENPYFTVIGMCSHKSFMSESDFMVSGVNLKSIHHWCVHSSIKMEVLIRIWLLLLTTWKCFHYLNLVLQHGQPACENCRVDIFQIK